MSSYYLGTTPVENLGDSPRYIYMLRRNEDGELFLVRSDQLIDREAYEINVPGDPENNFQDFEVGIDFLDGIDTNNDLIYPNLKYPQYRWDERPMFYYVDNDGNFVQRLFKGFSYPTGISS